MLGNNQAFNAANSTGFAGSLVGAAAISVIAGQSLGYPRVVTLVAGEAKLFNPVTAVAGNVLGITTHSAAVGEVIQVLTEGVFDYVGWGLTANALQFGTSAGGLSSVPPVGGLLQPVGLALSADRLLLNRQTPIVQI